MSNKSIKSFVYDIGETVIYKGRLYEVYTNTPFTIIKRSKEKNYYEWYTIQHQDGTVLNVKGDWIEKGELNENK